MIVLGIDEAGKGSLVGPMTISLVGIESQLYDIEKLERDGIKDSKIVSPKKRKKLTEEYRKEVYLLKTLTISTSQIDSYVYKGDLNKLLLLKYEELLSSIKVLDDTVVVYIDAFTTISTLISYFQKRYPLFSFIIEHKADTNYPIVSLASLFAKQEREDYLDNHNLRSLVGSGYPSDYRTKNYIKNNFEEYRNKNLIEIRYSWNIKL
jgi:ribonuclease HII